MIRNFAFVLLPLLAACESKTRSADARDFVDSRGKTVSVPYPPKRIVSIVPSVTELLFAVGAGDEVVGVTTHCAYPPEARAKTKVGDVQIDPERLLALSPDLIVTSYPMTKQTTADLEARGYAVFSVEANTLDEVARSLRLLGRVTAHAEEGEAAARDFLARVAAVPVPAQRRSVYFEVSPDPLWTAGEKTYAGDALRRAGGDNIFSGGWQAADWEVVLNRNPDVILITHDQRQTLTGRAGWNELKAVKNHHVYFVDKNHFDHAGPRLVRGLEEASRIFHEAHP